MGLTGARSIILTSHEDKYPNRDQHDRDHGNQHQARGGGEGEKVFQDAVFCGRPPPAALDQSECGV